MSGILSAFGGGSYGAPPSNTVAPAVTGTATFGQTLSTTNGTWTAAPPITGYAYQWQRAGSNISGATSSTYVLVSADVGNTIRCVVTATNAISSVASNSNSTASVAAAVPGIPTGVSATATSSSAISVSFSAPASNGGASIDYYQAVCTGSGTNSATGTSPISITGLNPSTSYTFQVRAHNSIGYGSYSSSTGTATTQAVTGSVLFTTYGNYSWSVPSGVSSISAVVAGPSSITNQGDAIPLYCCYGYGPVYVGTYYVYGTPGSSGATVYKNNQPVTPGCSYCITVTNGYGPTNISKGSSLLNSYGGNTFGGCWLYKRGGGFANCAGIRFYTYGGRPNGCGGYTTCSAGGSGAPGFGYCTLNTLTCGATNFICGRQNNVSGASAYGGWGGSGYAGKNGSGGGGGGGTSRNGGAGGGGISFYGCLSNGSGGSTASGGGGGGGGSNGSSPSGITGGRGGSYGGGAGGGGNGGTSGNRNSDFGQGGNPPGDSNPHYGAIRIVWPGSSRKFPSTCVGA
jgi:Fibronectin type III domain